MSLRGVSPEKVRVIYNGVDTKLFRKRRIRDTKLAGIREGSNLIFLNVAGLTPVKNHIALIQAFANLTKTHRMGRDTKLLICGAGPLRRELLAAAHRLEIHRQLVFLGQQRHSQMPEIYSLADAFVLPSLSEAHPWSLLEAMSCSLPSITSAVGGVPETIQDDRLMFNPHSSTSIDALTSRMLLVAEDAKRRRQIGARNRRTVLERFTIERHLKRLLQIYKEMVQ
jgi:glycosyltransferase involved in cell wall biosynthesis